MSKNETSAIINVSKIHEQRVHQAYAVVEKLFPLDASKIKSLSQEQIFAFETLTSRFGRLQDLIGSKMFDMCLTALGENITGLSMIDKANMLEKFGIIDSAHHWMELRKLRNNLTHEYPDLPEVTADILNNLQREMQPMLTLYNNILVSIHKAQSI